MAAVNLRSKVDLCAAPDKISLEYDFFLNITDICRSK